MLLRQRENLQAVYEGIHYDQKELTKQISRIYAMKKVLKLYLNLKKVLRCVTSKNLFVVCI